MASDPNSSRPVPARVAQVWNGQWLLSGGEQAAVRSWTDEEWLRLLRELSPQAGVSRAIAIVNQWRAEVPRGEAVEWLGQLLPDRSEGDFGPGGDELAGNVLDAMAVQGWVVVRKEQL